MGKNKLSGITIHHIDSLIRNETYNAYDKQSRGIHDGINEEIANDREVERYNKADIIVSSNKNQIRVLSAIALIGIIIVEYMVTSRLYEMTNGVISFGDTGLIIALVVKAFTVIFIIADIINSLTDRERIHAITHVIGMVDIIATVVYMIGR